MEDTNTPPAPTIAPPYPLMNRIIYKSEKDYQTTIRALMRAGAIFETGEDEGNLWIECAPNALAVEPKPKAPKPAPRDESGNESGSGNGGVSVLRGLGGVVVALLVCCKWLLIICAAVAFPFILLVPAFWSGVVAGATSGSGSGEGGGTGGG